MFQFSVSLFLLTTIFCDLNAFLLPRGNRFGHHRRGRLPSADEERARSSSTYEKSLFEYRKKESSYQQQELDKYLDECQLDDQIRLPILQPIELLDLGEFAQMGFGQLKRLIIQSLSGVDADYDETNLNCALNQIRKYKKVVSSYQRQESVQDYDGSGGSNSDKFWEDYRE